MSDVNNDLLYLILTRMPVKTLLQWRCVSRSWKQVIDSPGFIIAHLSLQRSRLIFQNKNSEYLVLDPQTLPWVHTLTGPHGVIQSETNLSSYSPRRYSRYRMGCLSGVCSLHGVICVYDNAKLLLLWNPSIRHLLRIPLPGFWVSRLSNPNSNYKYCGFWIDPLHKNFKIVLSCFNAKCAALFSSTKQSWVQMPVVYLLTYCICEHVEPPQVLIDGVAYWDINAAFKDDYQNDRKFIHGPAIFLFDFGKDKFGSMRYPQEFLLEYSSFCYDRNLFKWQGFLSFLRWRPGHGAGAGEGALLWAMQNGSWSKMLNFTCINPTLPSVFCALEDCGRVLALNHNGDLVLCDSKNECIPLCPGFRNHGVFCYATDFVESLVFPNINMFEYYLVIKCRE